MLDRNRLIDPVMLSFVRLEPRVGLGAKRSSDVGRRLCEAWPRPCPSALLR